MFNSIMTDKDWRLALQIQGQGLKFTTKYFPLQKKEDFNPSILYFYFMYLEQCGTVDYPPLTMVSTRANN